MVHRDVRIYDDPGRIAAFHVQLNWWRELESAFAKLLFLAMRAARAERDDGVPVPHL